MVKGRVLIAGSNVRATRPLCEALARRGYRATAATTGAQVRQGLERRAPDAVVLHAGGSTARFDPWLLLQELATASELPLLVLVSSGHPEQRLQALRAGARCCLTLPISPDELGAWVSAVLRAAPAGTLLPRPGQARRYHDDQVQIDLGNREVHRAGQLFTLTAREAPLLLRMLSSPGQMIPSPELCRTVWGPGAWPGKRHLLKTYIAQLRTKIEPEAGQPRYLVSRRGLGYAFVPQDGAEGDANT